MTWRFSWYSLLLAAALLVGCDTPEADFKRSQIYYVRTYMQMCDGILTIDRRVTEERRVELVLTCEVRR